MPYFAPRFCSPGTARTPRTCCRRRSPSWPRGGRDCSDQVSPDGYVRKILYNQRVSWWRRARQGREFVTSDPQEISAVADVAGDSALRLSVAQALRQLTPKQRAVVVLRYYEDLPEAQVAEILGCSVGTVKVQSRRQGKSGITTARSASDGEVAKS